MASSDYTVQLSLAKQSWPTIVFYSTPSSDNTVQIIFTQVQNLEKDMGIIYISLAG